MRFSRSAILQRLLVVAEVAAVRSRERGVERRLSPACPNGVWPGVVAEPDRLDEILVQPQGARDDPGDAGRLERVRHPRAVVVAGRVDEDLRLALQPPERLGMDDPVAVALERRANVRFRLGPQPAARLVGADGERREAFLLDLAHPLLERCVRISLSWGMRSSVSAAPVYPAPPGFEETAGLCGVLTRPGPRALPPRVDRPERPTPFGGFQPAVTVVATLAAPAGSSIALRGRRDAAPPFKGGGAGPESRSRAAAEATRFGLPVMIAAAS